jgi:3-hydroxymyristoyl/3-hydroxydecanoyl-(acyl carrier protein) dehydratase
VNVLSLTVPAEHPALAGHFPGAPILPGVLLLDEIVCALGADGGSLGRGHWHISTAKFVRPVRPGETLSFAHERLPNGSIRFSISCGGQRVAHGLLVPDEQQVR